MWARYIFSQESSVNLQGSESQDQASDHWGHADSSVALGLVVAAANDDFPRYIPVCVRHLNAVILNLLGAVIVSVACPVGSPRGVSFPLNRHRKLEASFSVVLRDRERRILVQYVILRVLDITTMVACE